MKYNSDCESNIYMVERRIEKLTEEISRYISYEKAGEDAGGLGWHINEMMKTYIGFLWYAKYFNDKADQEVDYYRRASKLATKLVEIYIPMGEYYPDIMAYVMQKAHEVKYDEHEEMTL